MTTTVASVDPSVLEAKKEIQRSLAPRERPEIVIGLVGPVGVDLDPVVQTIKEELRGHYTTDVIGLSKQIEEFFKVNYRHLPENERIGRLMTLGTMLRDESSRGDAVAFLGVKEISRIRDDKYGYDETTKYQGHAYVLRSLKTPEEVQMLRYLYGGGFFLISVYAPREVRLEALSRKIRRSMGGSDDFRSEAHALLDRDEKESSSEFGQNVRDAFPLADLFVYSRNTDRMKAQVRRFIQLVFGHRFLTPTRDEHGMQHARAAAYRSSDMNRQVGAAITNDEGDVLALGCNDVPKAHGGLYWPSDGNDDRDFRRRIDSMAEHRIQVLGELVNRLNDEGMLRLQVGETVGTVVESLVSGEKKKVLKNTAAMNVLEFGRSVHAEMAALTTAARLGIPIKDATLFCTTFPCHICARHIVASGIKRVVYVEPYPKSRAKQLHADSVHIDPVTPTSEHVNFEPFEGVAPRKYFELFNAADLRKDAVGRAVEWSMDSAMPRFLRFAYTYTKLEDRIIAETIPAFINLGLTVPAEWGANGEGDGSEKAKHS